MGGTWVWGEDGLGEGNGFGERDGLGDSDGLGERIGLGMEMGWVREMGLGREVELGLGREMGCGGRRVFGWRWVRLEMEITFSPNRPKLNLNLVLILTIQCMFGVKVNHSTDNDCVVLVQSATPVIQGSIEQLSDDLYLDIIDDPDDADRNQVCYEY